jgi:hypothetical protein
MESFSDRLMTHLKEIGWTPYSIWKWFKPLPKNERLSEQYIYSVCRGEKQPKDDETLKKLASVEGLGLSFETLKAWKNAAENTPEIIKKTQGLIEGALEAKGTGTTAMHAVVESPAATVDDLLKLSDDKLVEAMEQKFGVSRDVLWALIKQEKGRRKNK